MSPWKRRLVTAFVGIGVGSFVPGIWFYPEHTLVIGLSALAVAPGFFAYSEACRCWPPANDPIKQLEASAPKEPRTEFK